MENERGLHNVLGGVDGQGLHLFFGESIGADVSLLDQSPHWPVTEGALSQQAAPHLCKTRGDAERSKMALSC